MSPLLSRGHLLSLSPLCRIALCPCSATWRQCRFSCRQFVLRLLAAFADAGGPWLVCLLKLSGGWSSTNAGPPCPLLSALCGFFADDLRILALVSPPDRLCTLTIDESLALGTDIARAGLASCPVSHIVGECFV